MALEKLERILKHVADVEDIKKYEINVHEDPLRGNGFLSEFYTGSVKNKETGELIETYIKKLPIADGSYGPSAFFNEHHFYLNILPELIKFQKEKGVKTPFTNIPRFYCAGNKPGEEYICMENLRIQNFVMLDKSQSIYKDILNAIFENYGKYHALTFAFKDQNMEKYTELVSPLKDMYVEFGSSNGGFLQALTRTFGAAYNALKDIDMEIAKQVQPYAENIAEHYQKIMVYKGKFSGLVHGDCWSNNMLFKFRENGTIENIKFVDFQLCRDSTPIHDLSYFFYSGASKEDFKKLDEYLELYHKSFSAFARELGSDPDKLLPLNVLKTEWKKHSLLGIFMGIVLWQAKLMHKDIIEEVTTGQSEEVFYETLQNIIESNTFKENTSAILLHAVEYGIL